jgi:hypothetical protein
MKKLFDVFQGDVSHRILAVIHRWDWLQASEIAAFLFPGSDASLRYVRSRLEVLADEKLVLARQLPGPRAGRAWVLTQAGAAKLTQLTGQKHQRGTRWGSAKNGIWRPPGNWKHEVLVKYIAAAWVAAQPDHDPVVILTDKELRAFYMPSFVGTKKPQAFQRKIPDLLLIYSDRYQVVEIEQTRKTGAEMAALARFVVETSIGDCHPFRQFTGSRRADGIVVVVPEGMNDDRGYIVDHELRLRNAIGRVSPQRTVYLTLVKVGFSDGGFTPISATMRPISVPQDSQKGEPQRLAPILSKKEREQQETLDWEVLQQDAYHANGGRHYHVDGGVM